MTTDNYRPQFPTETIQEGKVRVLVPKLKEFVKKPFEYAPSKAPVFYNPVMELNRDVAVLVLQAYQRQIGRGITVCEPLTGCGLRGIRFAAEINGVERVVIADINEKAFRLAKHNVEINRLHNCVTVKNLEANLILSIHGAPYRRFDVVDLDPFGSPVEFLDSAFRALRNRGLLALTATDMASLCGVHAKACIRKYGGRPLRTEYCHELAVRLLSGCLATLAAKHDIGTRIVFSHRGEHYVRIYATIDYGARHADQSLENMGFIAHCFKCFHREIVKGSARIVHSGSCVECGSRLSFAGPLWIGKISEGDFCDLIQREAERRTLKSARKSQTMLNLIRNESDATSTYYVVDKMCDVLRLPVPPIKRVVEELSKEGFQAQLTHFASRGIRSDVPASRLAKMLHELTNYLSAK